MAMARTTITMSEADFLASQRTFYKTRWGPRLILLLGVLATLYTAVQAADALARHAPRHLLDLIPLALVCAVDLWVGGSFLWGTPFGARRYFRQSQMPKPMEFEWDDAGIGVRGATHSHRHAWGDLLRWKEDWSSIVIATTDRSFIPVPKRLFTEEALAELRTRLQKVRRV
jgi:hypothetical protein